jgi:hypothetical protein
MTRLKWITPVLSIVLVLVALLYLRDPPWLAGVTSGLRHWETDDYGVRYRWTTGHAWFFVPSSSEIVTFRMRAPKEDPRDWPITATITIDDRPADAIKVSEEDWSVVRLRLPARGGRRLRRIDIKLDRVRSGNRGVQLQIDGMPLARLSPSGEGKLAQHR